jgi:RES domain
MKKLVIKFREKLGIKKSILCSNCFGDEGLKKEAQKIGIKKESLCRNCNSKSGNKLNRVHLYELAYRFFVLGTMMKCEYGSASVLEFNNYQKTSIMTSPWFENDIKLIEKAIGIGFFYNAPRLWMVGENERLKDLQGQSRKNLIIERIVNEYPSMEFSPEEKFYRIRKYPKNPNDFSEYDSPPDHIVGNGRLESKDLPVLYGSKDLQLCLHECRVIAEDELFVSTLVPRKLLNLLDLTEMLCEKFSTEFESLDIAVHMLFLAGNHSYNILREIALAARRCGYDGILYPSYFSLLRTGFEAGSLRKFPDSSNKEKTNTINNIAIFGHPIAEDKIEVVSLNRIVLSKVEYEFRFGPVGHLEDQVYSDD